MDERQNKPSASAIQRIAECPASLRLSLANAIDFDRVSKTSEDVQHGDTMHFYMEHGTVPKNASEREIIEWVRETEKNLVEETFGTKEYVTIRETRFWAKDLSYSGKPDVLYISKDKKEALIIDYKFGHLEAPESSGNLQLATLATLANQAYPDLEKIRCAILQPYVSRKVEVVAYSRQDLIATEKYINRVLEIAGKSDSVCRPAEKTCRYCPALSYCPAVVLTMQKVSPIADVDKAWYYWNPEQRKQAYDIAQLAKRFVARVEANIKNDLENGIEIQGLELAQGKLTPRIVDPQGVFQVLNARFPDEITASAFVKCCKVSLPEVAKLVHVAMNKEGTKASVKACRSEMELMIQDYIEQTRSAPSIKSSIGSDVM